MFPPISMCHESKASYETSECNEQTSSASSKSENNKSVQVCFISDYSTKYSIYSTNSFILIININCDNMWTNSHMVFRELHVDNIESL